MVQYIGGTISFDPNDKEAKKRADEEMDNIHKDSIKYQWKISLWCAIISIIIVLLASLCNSKFKLW